MSKYNEIKAALLGAGTVGGGVYKLIEKRKSEMPSKVQAELTITKVLVKNLNKKREGIPDEVLTDDWQEILDDPKISIVIELMGGIEPARTYILEALKAGKNVVTANKDLLAEHGKELMDAAEEYHKDLYFEAAVGGGIPIIRPLKECLAVGADQAFLVTDRAFGGSDTLATSYILSRAIAAVEAKIGEKFDLIFCGKQAIDGDTAQVGPEIAELCLM